MLEKLKRWIGLKEVILLVSIIGAAYSTYGKVNDHEILLWSHNNQIQNLEKEDIRLNVKLASLEKKQNSTDAKLDKLNESILVLNNTMIRLSTILEQKLK